MHDRTVHAEGGEMRVVRYDRAGKWWIEYDPPRLRNAHQVSLADAVSWALTCKAIGGTIHFGRRGGSTFDRRVKAAYK